MCRKTTAKLNNNGYLTQHGTTNSRSNNNNILHLQRRALAGCPQTFLATWHKKGEIHGILINLTHNGSEFRPEVTK
jgi:hypothetical protein